jgi:hypothetical protein
MKVQMLEGYARNKRLLLMKRAFDGIRLENAVHRHSAGKNTGDYKRLRQLEEEYGDSSRQTSKNSSKRPRMSMNTSSGQSPY